jgi:hypothetical protein
MAGGNGKKRAKPKNKATYRPPKKNRTKKA